MDGAGLNIPNTISISSPAVPPGQSLLSSAAATSSNAGPKVFQLWPTGETFTKYADYVSQLIAYKQPIWSCRFTARSNLSFQAAWESEQRVAGQIEALPDSLRMKLFARVHGSRESLDALAQILVEMGIPAPAIGDTVRVSVEGQPMRGQIVGIDDNGSDPVQYKVELLGPLTPEEDAQLNGHGTSNTPISTSTSTTSKSTTNNMLAGEVGASGSGTLRVLNSKSLVSKALAKKLIRGYGTRDPESGAWFLDPPVARRYGQEVPQQLQVQNALVESDVQILSDDGSTAAVVFHHDGTLRAATGNAFPIPYAGAHMPPQVSHDRSVHEQLFGSRRMMDVPIPIQMPSYLTLDYPLEDDNQVPLELLNKDAKWPTPTQTSLRLRDLESWNFVNAFGAHLELSPFPLLPHWEYALKCDPVDDSSLDYWVIWLETILALMKPLMSHRKTISKTAFSLVVRQAVEVHDLASELFLAKNPFYNSGDDDASEKNEMELDTMEEQQRESINVSSLLQTSSAYEDADEDMSSVATGSSSSYDKSDSMDDFIIDEDESESEKADDESDSEDDSGSNRKTRIKIAKTATAAKKGSKGRAKKVSQPKRQSERMAIKKILSSTSSSNGNATKRSSSNNSAPLTRKSIRQIAKSLPVIELKPSSKKQSTVKHNTTSISTRRRGRPPQSAKKPFNVREVESWFEGSTAQLLLLHSEQTNKRRTKPDAALALIIFTSMLVEMESVYAEDWVTVILNCIMRSINSWTDLEDWFLAQTNDFHSALVNALVQINANLPWLRDLINAQVEARDDARRRARDLELVRKSVRRDLIDASAIARSLQEQLDLDKTEGETVEVPSTGDRLQLHRELRQAEAKQKKLQNQYDQLLSQLADLESHALDRSRIEFLGIDRQIRHYLHVDKHIIVIEPDKEEIIEENVQMTNANQNKTINDAQNGDPIDLTGEVQSAQMITNSDLDHEGGQNEGGSIESSTFPPYTFHSRSKLTFYEYKDELESLEAWLTPYGAHESELLVTMELCHDLKTRPIEDQVQAINPSSPIDTIKDNDLNMIFTDEKTLPVTTTDDDNTVNGRRRRQPRVVVSITSQPISKNKLAHHPKPILYINEMRLH